MAVGKIIWANWFVVKSIFRRLSLNYILIKILSFKAFENTLESQALWLKFKLQMENDKWKAFYKSNISV